MSLIHVKRYPKCDLEGRENLRKYEKKCQRNVENDLKKALDLFFDLRNLLDELHPSAIEFFIKLMK